LLQFVGRIQPLNGPDVAIRALAELGDPRATLVIVGGASGPDGDIETRRATALVDELGLHDRVRFVPPQPHHILSTYYRAADVVLAPSRSESFGLVALEAAACGVPVVASAVGGLISLVDDGRTGRLIDGRDPADFARAVSEILGDDHVRAAMRGAAVARARNYTWGFAAARLRRLYSDLTVRELVTCQ
jgi:D-inositol-3-phosphate glycosyltransferase